MPPTATRGTRQRFYNQLARNVRSSETFSLSVAPLDQHTNESLSAYGGGRSSLAAPAFSGPVRPVRPHQSQEAAQAQAQGGQGTRRQQEGVDLLDGWSERTRETRHEDRQQTTAGRHPGQEQAQPHPHQPHQPHQPYPSRAPGPALTADDSQDIYLSRRTRRTRSRSTGSSSERSLFRDRDREREHDRTPPPRKTVQNWLQTSSTAQPPERQPSIPSSRDSPPPQQRHGSTSAQKKRPQQQQQPEQRQTRKQPEQMQYPPSIPGYRPDQFQQPIYLSSPGAGVAVGGSGGGRGGYDRSMDIAALQEERKVYESLQRRLADRSSQADSIETLRAANERLLAVLQQKNYALSQGQSTHPALSPHPAPSLAPQSLSAHPQALPTPTPAPPQHTELHLEISRLQRELDIAKRDLDDKAERLAAAEKERDGAKKGQSTTAKVNHEMEVRVREAEERCKHEMGRCDALEKRLREAESQSKVSPYVAKELEVKRAQLANAHRERESFTAKHRSLENDYAKLADKLKVSRVEKEALQARVAELVAQQAEVEKLQADKKMLKDLLLKERADSDRLRKERSALREQLESRSKTKASHRQARECEPHRERERDPDHPRAERERTYDDVPPDGIGYGTGKGEVIDDFGDEPSRRETGVGRGAYAGSMVDPEPSHRAQQAQPRPQAQTQAPGLGKYSPLKPARQGPLGMSTPLEPSRPTASGSGGQSSMGMGLGLNLGMGMAQPLEPDHRRSGAAGAGAGPSMSMPMGDRVSVPMNPNYHNPNPNPGSNPSHMHAAAAGTNAFETLMGAGTTAPQQVDPFADLGHAFKI